MVETLTGECHASARGNAARLLCMKMHGLLEWGSTGRHRAAFLPAYLEMMEGASALDPGNEVSR